MAGLTISSILSEAGYSQLKLMLDRAESVDDFLFEADEILEHDDYVVPLQTPIEFPEELSNERSMAENLETVYEAIGTLDRASAANGRLWSHLAVFTFRDYMMNRWNPHKVRSWKQRLKDRWVLQNVSRGALARHEIARMWWIAELTFDGEGLYPLPAPYEGPLGAAKWVTEVEDRIINIFDRKFSGYPEILRPLIQVMVTDTSSDRGGAIKRVTRELRVEGAFRELPAMGDQLPGLIRQLAGAEPEESN